MLNFLIVVVLLLVLGGAVIYIIRQKKKGVKCIGCPYAGNCGGHCKEE